MMPRKINVIKGFTVPPGYSLRITKDDGETVEKRPGEQSGGQYSFEQVVQGVDPDWELTEEASMGQPYFLTPDMLSNAEVPIEAFDNREFSKFEAIPKEVTEFLGGLAKPLRTKIFAKTEGKISNLQALSIDEIKADPEYEAYGGYFNPVLAEEQLVGQVSKVVAQNRKPERGYSHATHTLAALYHWDELHPVTKELSTFDDFHATIIEKTTEMEDVVIGGDYIERTKLPDELPPLGEGNHLTYKDLRSAIFSLKNPKNIRALFKKTVRGDAYKSHLNRLEEIKFNIDTISKDVQSLQKEFELITATLDESIISVNTSVENYNYSAQKYNDARDNPSAANEVNRAMAEFQKAKMSYEEQDANFRKLASEKQRVASSLIEAEALVIKTKANLKREKESFFVNKFRQVMVDNVNIDDFIETAWGVDKLSQEQKDGLAFAVGFVHPVIRPKMSLKIDNSVARASANSLGVIRCSPWDKPATFAHEAGHLIEYSNRIGATTVMPFLYNRIGKTGEKSVKFNELVPDSGYEEWESSIRDNFSHFYTGKIYSFRSNILGQANDPDGYTLRDCMESGGISATEVVSMGIQHMYEDPMGFAERDPEFFDMIWNLRSSPKIRRKKRDSD